MLCRRMNLPGHVKCNAIIRNGAWQLAGATVTGTYQYLPQSGLTRLRNTTLATYCAARTLQRCPTLPGRGLTLLGSTRPVSTFSESVK